MFSLLDSSWIVLLAVSLTGTVLFFIFLKKYPVPFILWYEVFFSSSYLNDIALPPPAAFFYPNFNVIGMPAFAFVVDALPWR